MKNTEEYRARGRRRMGDAINRGMRAATLEGKNRALLWVARWAVVAGIQDRDGFSASKKKRWFL